MHKLLYPVLSGVLSHILFHHLYPASISVPLLLSACLAAYSVLPKHTGPAWHQGANDVVLAFGTYLSTLLFSIVAYRLSPFHPLAQYPGPVLAKVTRLWCAWHAWTGKQNQVFLRLHETYGPFVRTAPNEISVSDVRAVTDVLGAGGIPKGEYYSVRTDPSAPNNILAVTGEEHDTRRRLWNRGMGNDSLTEYEHIIARRGNELVDRLRAESRRGTNGMVNVVRWFEYFAFDFMGDMAFGGGFHLVTEGEDKRGIWHLLEVFIHSTHLHAHLPWATPALMKLSGSARDVLSFRQLGLQSAKNRVKAGSRTKDLWYHLSDEAELEKSRPPMQNVIADGTLAIIAGSDTTATALGAFFYFVLHDDECYKRLREEIDRVYPPGSDPMDTSRHAQLVWLNACMDETLRLAPPIPTNGPRQVPYSSPGAMVADRFVPSGTQIYVAPYVLHRDPRYFSPSPEKFIPARWLAAESSDGKADASTLAVQEGAALNHLAFIPFSYGPANCVGKGLARLEMRMVICALMQNFNFELDPDVERYSNQKDWVGDLRDYLVTVRDPLWVRVIERMA